MPSHARMRSRARSRAGLSGRLVAVMGRRGYTARTAASAPRRTVLRGTRRREGGCDATNRSAHGDRARRRWSRWRSAATSARAADAVGDHRRTSPSRRARSRSPRATPSPGPTPMRRPTPRPAAAFDTERLDPGRRRRVTFSTAGSFAYVCAIHPQMTGTVVVAGRRAPADRRDRGATPPRTDSPPIATATPRPTSSARSPCCSPRSASRCWPRPPGRAAEARRRRARPLAAAVDLGQGRQPALAGHEEVAEPVAHDVEVLDRAGRACPSGSARGSPRARAAGGPAA